MDKKFLDLGVIKHVKGTNDNGEEYSFLAIDLKQNVDILVKGEKVNFSTYEGKDGNTYANKSVSISPVADSLARLKTALDEEKISQEMYDDITSSYEKRNVKYTLGVTSKAQA